MTFTQKLSMWWWSMSSTTLRRNVRTPVEASAAAHSAGAHGDSGAYGRKSVLEWFDGRIAVELRLWDALEQGLLCPFQYFGSHDGTDLAHVQWSRYGYDVTALENIYTGDQSRVALIIQTIHDKIANPFSIRALGFCVM